MGLQQMQLQHQLKSAATFLIVREVIDASMYMKGPVKIQGMQSHILMKHMREMLPVESVRKLLETKTR